MTTRHSSETARKLRRGALVFAVLLGAACGFDGSPAAAKDDPVEPWVWPGGIRAIVRDYEQPPTPYEAGHRGIDVATSEGDIVAPATGTVAFRGLVVDRPLLTIDHGDGLVSTLEPVSSDLAPGDTVHRGQSVGTLASGGHTPAGALHLGARLDGQYVNPLALLGAVERPVLLPCCG